MNKTKNKQLKKFRKTKRGGSWFNSIFSIFKSKPANGTQATPTINASKTVTNASNPVSNVPKATNIPKATNVPKPVTNTRNPMNSSKSSSS
jgi:hypothetical protein